MNDADHFANVFSLRVLLRINPKLFVWLAGDIATRKVLLLATDSQQQATALFRVFGFLIVRLFVKAREMTPPNQHVYIWTFGLAVAIFAGAASLGTIAGCANIFWEARY